MTLQYIREAVVACPDVAARTEFLVSAFGFEVLHAANGEALLGAPGAPSGRIRLREVAGPVASDVAVWDIGPRLLGIYSHDLDATFTAINEAGGASRVPVTYPYGTASLSELVADSGDGVWWTVPLAVPGAHRPSDAYAADPERLHSELHTAVLVVDDHDAARAFFEAGGLEVVFDGEMSGAPFDELVGMSLEASLRLTFLGDADHLPARFELMSFTGVDAVDRTQQAHGIQRLVFVCDDAAATRQALIAAGAEELADGGLRGPVGVILDLVDESAQPLENAQTLENAQ